MALPSKFKYFTGLSAGTYTITIRDAKDVLIFNYYYSEPRPMVIEKTVIPYNVLQVPVTKGSIIIDKITDGV
jgi:hypothetical protein